MTDERERERDEAGDEDATSVMGPTGTPPDADLAYDRSMTDEDEANIPAESEADPKA